MNVVTFPLSTVNGGHHSFSSYFTPTSHTPANNMSGGLSLDKVLNQISVMSVTYCYLAILGHVQHPTPCCHIPTMSFKHRTRELSCEMTDALSAIIIFPFWYCSYLPSCLLVLLLCLVFFFFFFFPPVIGPFSCLFLQTIIQ